MDSQTDWNSRNGFRKKIQGEPKMRQTKCFYTPYITIEDALKGLSTKTLFEGVLRINQKKYEEGYVDDPYDGEASDILIFGLHDRNRALQGDRVVFRIKNRHDWAITGEEYKRWEKNERSSVAVTINGDPACEVVEQHDQEIADALNDGLVIDDAKKVTWNNPTKIITYTRQELLSLRPHNIHNSKEASCSGIVKDTCDAGGAVVYIMEKKHPRVAVGNLKLLSSGSKKWILFSPSDSRISRIIIPGGEAPDGFFDRPQDFSKFLYVAQIKNWPASSHFARGSLTCFLGLAGDIESETKGLLMANVIDTSEFPESALLSLNIDEETEWKIPDEELKYRRDFRNEVVFTIDPVTARDRDDALHIKPIVDCDGAGTSGWEVGVHISDVGYFVKLGTELDAIAAKRGTSVYLVDKVIPMLPRVLCENLCSLTAGVDRLTMSVVWKVDDEGNIYDEWFGRSVICACCQLSYEHAQELLENPQGDINQDQYPAVYGAKTLEDIRTSLLRLNKLAHLLYQKRVRNGLLQVEQPKLCFCLREKNIPCGVSVYEKKEANCLVEEFMLLANMAVARRIEEAFPKKALLRRHPPPNPYLLRMALEKCDFAGFHVDGSSSASIASSLARCTEHSKSAILIYQVLSTFLLKSMQLAVYFCTGKEVDRKRYAHYALSVPLYTHFTSPIRRYPDILVHRLLAAALGYEAEPKLDVAEISAIATHCNDTKMAARIVSDANAQLFFCLFVKECGPLVERAVVMHVLDASFDVLIVKYGIVKRVYLNKVEFPKPYEYNDSEVMPCLNLYWQYEKSSEIFEQKIGLCTVLDVMLSSTGNSLTFEASIVKPDRPKGLKLKDFSSDLSLNASCFPR